MPIVALGQAVSLCVQAQVFHATHNSHTSAARARR